MFVLHCFSPKEFPKERLQETLVLLDNLMYLVYDVKQHLKLGQVEVLCRLVECSISTIVLQKKGIDLQDDPAALQHEIDPNLFTPIQLTEIPEEMSSLLRKQCLYVDGFIDMRLPVHIKDQELQVSDC